MKNEEYLKPEQASKILQIHPATLANWEKAGKIRCVRTVGGHRRYRKEDLIQEETDEEPGRRICYCRVSTASQKTDLERQAEVLRNQYPSHEIIKDIGSGLNFKRKGLNTLLDEALRGNIKEVVVTYRDRLCRFGFEIFQRIIERGGGTIVVLNQKNTSPEEELVQDLLEIVTIFSSRLYRLRSHIIKKDLEKWKIQDPENKDLPDAGRKGKAK